MQIINFEVIEKKPKKAVILTKISSYDDIKELLCHVLLNNEWNQEKTIPGRKAFWQERADEENLVSTNTNQPLVQQIIPDTNEGTNENHVIVACDECGLMIANVETHKNLYHSKDNIDNMDTDDQLLQVADTDAVIDNSLEEIVQAEAVIESEQDSEVDVELQGFLVCLRSSDMII